MLNPIYKLTIGSKVVDTTDKLQASTLIDMIVALDMDTPADSFTLLLGNVDGLKPVQGDKAAIELGYADNGGLKQVITGSVESVEPGLITTRIVGYSAAYALLRSNIDQTYEGKKAGDLVKDLAGIAKVDVSSADDGIAFPAYVIDGRRSFYQHMRDLADLSGLDLYINSDGKLVLEKFTGGKIIHVFEYGKQILELEILHTPPEAELVEAWGESPGGSKPAAAWAWLTKDFKPYLGSAGSGSSKLLVERSALRTSKAAHIAAEAARSRIQEQTVRGRLLLPGQPQVRLGDAVRLAGVPDNLSGTFQVRSITHRITKACGFTTSIGFRSIVT